MLFGLPLETEALLYSFLGDLRSTRLAGCSKSIYHSYIDRVDQEISAQTEAYRQTLGNQDKNL